MQAAETESKLTFLTISPPPTIAADGRTAITAMRPAANIADAASAIGSLRRVRRNPVAESCSPAITKADTELMVANMAILDAESAAADATTCVQRALCLTMTWEVLMHNCTKLNLPKCNLQLTSSQEIPICAFCKGRQNRLCNKDQQCLQTSWRRQIGLWYTSLAG